MDMAGSTDVLRDRQSIALWPGVPPGSEACRATPTVIERSTTLFKPDRALTGVATPSLTVIAPEKPNGASMIVAPGGSYARIVLDKEGFEIADWLCPLGVTIFLLTYRLPAEGHQNGRDVPLQDGQRAVRLVRTFAERWGLDPKRIGFLGFSAAGHIAASLVATPERKVAPEIDAIDHASARPDFAVLVYPVVSMESGVAHADSRANLLGDNATADVVKTYSPDCHVTAAAPPAFIVAADDDAVVPAENSVRFYMALKTAGVGAELHIFRDGGHGFGIEHARGLPVRRWPVLCEDWLRRIAVVS